MEAAQRAAAPVERGAALDDSRPQSLLGELRGVPCAGEEAALVGVSLGLHDEHPLDGGLAEDHPSRSGSLRQVNASA